MMIVQGLPPTESALRILAALVAQSGGKIRLKRADADRFGEGDHIYCREDGEDLVVTVGENGNEGQR